jgi:cobalamin biosynthetic protein CobC
LPQTGDALLAAAAAYYRAAPDRLLAVPGSQYATGVLPELCAPGPVALPRWGYREHESAWRRAGHAPVHYEDIDHLQNLVAAGAVRYVIVINPNNPTAALIAPGVLLALATRLAEQDGLLVIDEAFVDTHPVLSVLPTSHRAIVVLRSLGKFFGLAGVRLGFVCAAPSLLAQIRATLEPWSINHPAQWIGALALGDRCWQQQQRHRLRRASRQWLGELPDRLPNLQWRRTALFAAAELPLPTALAIRHEAGQRGVLVRVYTASSFAGETVDPNTAWLRIGLPRHEDRDRALAILRAATIGATPDVTRHQRGSESSSSSA